MGKKETSGCVKGFASQDDILRKRMKKGSSAAKGKGLQGSQGGRHRGQPFPRRWNSYPRDHEAPSGQVGRSALEKEPRGRRVADEERGPLSQVPCELVPSPHLALVLPHPWISSFIQSAQRLSSSSGRRPMMGQTPFGRAGAARWPRNEWSRVPQRPLFAALTLVYIVHIVPTCGS